MRRNLFHSCRILHQLSKLPLLSTLAVEVANFPEHCTTQCSKIFLRRTRMSFHWCTQWRQSSFLCHSVKRQNNWFLNTIWSSILWYFVLLCLERFEATIWSSGSQHTHSTVGVSILQVWVNCRANRWMPHRISVDVCISYDLQPFSAVELAGAKDPGWLPPDWHRNPRRIGTAWRRWTGRPGAEWWNRPGQGASGNRADHSEPVQGHSSLFEGIRIRTCKQFRPSECNRPVSTRPLQDKLVISAFSKNLQRCLLFLDMRMHDGKGNFPLLLHWWFSYIPSKISWHYLLNWYKLD